MEPPIPAKRLNMPSSSSRHYYSVATVSSAYFSFMKGSTTALMGKGLRTLNTRLTYSRAGPPQTEYKSDLRPRWTTLQARNIELAVCIASGVKRGVVDAAEQQRYDLPSQSLIDDFALVGLGQLITAIEESDRYVEFPA